MRVLDVEMDAEHLRGIPLCVDHLRCLPPHAMSSYMYKKRHRWSTVPVQRLDAHSEWGGVSEHFTGTVNYSFIRTFSEPSTGFQTCEPGVISYTGWFVKQTERTNNKGIKGCSQKTQATNRKEMEEGRRTKHRGEISRRKLRDCVCVQALVHLHRLSGLAQWAGVELRGSPSRPTLCQALPRSASCHGEGWGGRGWSGGGGWEGRRFGMTTGASAVRCVEQKPRSSCTHTQN